MLGGYRRIIAAGGDGTIHEVGNGLIQSGCRDALLAVWPLGSANDYAASLDVLDWFERRGQGVRLQPRLLDVVRVSGGGRERVSLNCLGLGFNGMVVIEARKIHSLRGMPLYTLAFLRAMLWRFATPDLEVVMDGKPQTRPTLSLSINNGIREGGFPITRQARLDDGSLDYVQVYDLSRWGMIRHLPGLMTGNLPQQHPKVSVGRCRRVDIQSATPLCVHADGEFFSRPEDGIDTITAEILPRQLLVEVGPRARLGEPIPA